MSITNTEGYFVKYTSLVPEENITEAFKNQDEILKDFCESITEEKSSYAYAEGKWTLKEVLQHLIDTERVFAYRALAIARGETSTLHSFDENEYAANSNANARGWEEMAMELYAVRATTKMMYASFSDKMLSTEGKFSSNTSSVETLGQIIIGHIYHHINIVKERYF